MVRGGLMSWFMVVRGGLMSWFVVVQCHGLWWFSGSWLRLVVV